MASVFDVLIGSKEIILKLFEGMKIFLFTPQRELLSQLIASWGAGEVWQWIFNLFGFLLPPFIQDMSVLEMSIYALPILLVLVYIQKGAPVL